MGSLDFINNNQSEKTKYTYSNDFLDLIFGTEKRNTQLIDNFLSDRKNRQISSQDL